MMEPHSEQKIKSLLGKLMVGHGEGSLHQA